MVLVSFCSLAPMYFAYIFNLYSGYIHYTIQVVYRAENTSLVGKIGDCFLQLFYLRPFNPLKMIQRRYSPFFRAPCRIRPCQLKSVSTSNSSNSYREELRDREIRVVV